MGRAGAEVLVVEVVDVEDCHFEDRSVHEDGVVGVVADVLRDDRDLEEMGGVLSAVSAVTPWRVVGEVGCGADNVFIGISSSTSETLKAVLVIALSPMDLDSPTSTPPQSPIISSAHKNIQTH
jgi:hypothetical protein